MSAARVRPWMHVTEGRDSGAVVVGGEGRKPIIGVGPPLSLNIGRINKTALRSQNWDNAIHLEAKKGTKTSSLRLFVTSGG